jgi:hypothetical protein
LQPQLVFRASVLDARLGICLEVKSTAMLGQGVGFVNQLLVKNQLTNG